MGTSTLAQSVLQQEIATYKRMRSRLELEHLGQWVVIHDDELVGAYDTFEFAAENAARRFDLRSDPCLIRQVGAPPVTEASLPFRVRFGITHAHR